MLNKLADLNNYVKVKILGDEDSDSESEEEESKGSASDNESGDQNENSESDEEASEDDEENSQESSDEESKEESKEEPSKSHKSGDFEGGESEEEKEEKDKDSKESNESKESHESKLSAKSHESEGDDAGAEESDDDEEEEGKLPKKIEITKKLVSKYDVIVLTEIFEDILKVIEINDLCRECNKGFILAQCLGAYGYTFVDFGDKFMCKDKNGEEHDSFNIVGITKAKKAELTVHKSKPHSFGEGAGDRVVFQEIEGMEELNDLKEPVKIKVIDQFTIELDLDTRKFGDYERNGIVTSVNVPEKVKFQRLEDAINNPHKIGPGFFNTIDLANFGRADQLHIGLQAIYKFQVDHKRLPKNKRGDVHEVVKNAKDINKKLKKKKNTFSVENLEEGVVKLMAKFARNQITPMTSFFGGIVCQEIVKYTGKFTPMTGK